MKLNHPWERKSKGTFLLMKERSCLCWPIPWGFPHVAVPVWFCPVYGPLPGWMSPWGRLHEHLQDTIACQNSRNNGQWNFASLVLEEGKKLFVSPKGQLKDVALSQKPSPGPSPLLRVSWHLQVLRLPWWLTGARRGIPGPGLWRPQQLLLLKFSCAREEIALEDFETQLTVWIFEKVKPTFNKILKKHFIFIYTVLASFLFCTFPGNMLIESVCHPTSGNDEAWRIKFPLVLSPQLYWVLAIISEYLVWTTK